MQSYKLFNRGYSKGYFYADEKLMNMKYSSNFGYLLANVNDNNEIKLLDDIMLGDGIQYVDENYEKISGEYINKIYINKHKVEKAKNGDIVFIGSLPENTKYIYKNYSKQINDDIKHKLKITKRQMPIVAELKVIKENRLQLTMKVTNNNGKVVFSEVFGDIIAENAKNIITYDKVLEKISELGETTFYLEEFKFNYDNVSFFAFSELKKLKRECAEQLYSNLLKSYVRKSLNGKSSKFDNSYCEDPVISALVSTEKQAQICRDMGITKIYKKQFDVAKENKLDKISINTNLISNMYQLSLLSKYDEVIKASVDWNLNIFNNYTISLYSKFKCVDTVFLSPELNYSQLKEIKSGNIKKGIVVYGYLKSMYIEYKIFDKTYKELHGSYGDDYKVLKNDIDNIEVYLNKPMNLIPKIDEIKKLGLDELRLDFTFESDDEVVSIIKSLKDGNGKYNPYAFESGVY